MAVVAILIAFLLPAVQSVREAAHKSQLTGGTQYDFEPQAVQTANAPAGQLPRARIQAFTADARKHHQQRKTH